MTATTYARACGLSLSTGVILEFDGEQENLLRNLGFLGTKKKGPECGPFIYPAET